MGSCPSGCCFIVTINCNSVLNTQILTVFLVVSATVKEHIRFADAGINFCCT